MSPNFPLPDVVWTLSPTIGTAVVDAILAFRPIKICAFAHVKTPIYEMQFDLFWFVHMLPAKYDPS